MTVYSVKGLLLFLFLFLASQVPLISAPFYFIIRSLPISAPFLAFKSSFAWAINPIIFPEGLGIPCQPTQQSAQTPWKKKKKKTMLWCVFSLKKIPSLKGMFLFSLSSKLEETGAYYNPYVIYQPQPENHSTDADRSWYQPPTARCQ